MKFVIHQTHHTIGDFKKIYQSLIQDLTKNEKETSPVVHLYPELFLTGYPLQDLCLSPDFIENYHQLLKSITEWGKANLKSNTAALFGGLKYTFNKGHGQLRPYPDKIENGIYALTSLGLEYLYSKCLLPNYDIFDEAKYFTAGTQSLVWNFAQKNLALQVCEDMWISTVHQRDPVLELNQYCQKNNLALDAIVNLSASPFNIGKNRKRQQRGQEISKMLKAPFIYVNRVGGEDEILFDGQSFVANQEKIELNLKKFAADEGQYLLSHNKAQTPSQLLEQKKENTWESLFLSHLFFEQGKIKLRPLTEEDCQEIFEALKFGFKEYASKTKHNRFSIALSGGIDSGLVCALAKLALQPGDYLEAVYMPSIYSSPLSYELSQQLCHNLNIPLFTFPIKFLHSMIKNQVKENFHQDLTGPADENIQSRLRGSLIYLRSNQIGSLVINTSNKSELAVGYSTQYGDSVGAISLLGDLYKGQVIQLSHYLNRQFNSLIPAAMIERPPTAELRENQRDDQSLPPYDILDTILEGLLGMQCTVSDLISFGLPKKDCLLAQELFLKSEYKRFQFCPIIKLHPKSFGVGHRIPICKTTTTFDLNDL